MPCTFIRSRLAEGLLTLAALSVALSGCTGTPETNARIVPQIGPVQPRRVEFAAQGEPRLLVVEASGRIGVWDVRNPATPSVFASIPAAAIDAAFCPDGRSIVSVGADGRVRWWASDGEPLRVSATGHTGPSRAVAAAADAVVSGGEDGTVRLWRMDGSALGPPLEGHGAAVVSVAISARGDLLSVGNDGTVRRWRRNGESPEGVPVYDASIVYRQPRPPDPGWLSSALKYDVNWGWDHSVVFSPSGAGLAAAVFDGAVRVWNADGSLRSEILDAHAKRHVRGLAFSSDGNVLASAGFDGRVHLWNLDGSPRGAPIEAHLNLVYSVSFSPQGENLATAGADNRVRLWTIDGVQISELPAGRQEPITAVAVAPRALVLAVMDGSGAVRLWNLDGSPSGHPISSGAVAALGVSPTGDLVASGAADGGVRLWSLDGSPRGEALAAHGAALHAVALAPDGTTVASGSDAVRVSRAGGKAWEQPAQTPDWITTLAFSPTGELIAAGSVLGRLQVWNIDGTPRTAPFKLPRENIQALVFAPDGQSFASAGGSENIIRLWGLDGTADGPPLAGNPGVITALASSPEAGVLASGSADGMVRIWRWPSHESVAIDVGLPVDQIGFARRLLWVRADGDSVFFYDADRRLVATALLLRDAVVVFTPDGWFAGPQPTPLSLRVFGASGDPLSDQSAARRFSPERVRAALLHAAG